MANYRLQEATQLQGRSIFVDANVLIYLFWPTGRHRFEKKLCKGFQNFINTEKRFVCRFSGYFRSYQQGVKN